MKRKVKEEWKIWVVTVGTTVYVHAFNRFTGETKVKALTYQDLAIRVWQDSEFIHDLLEERS